MARIFAGIDPSLTSTGVVVLAAGEQLTLASFASKPTGTSLAARRDRLWALTTAVKDAVRRDGTHEYVVLVEAPTYATHSGSQHDRSGLWWLLVDELLDLGPVLEVSPTTVKAFATGRGNADKTAMAVTAAREFPGAPLKNDDQVDALWIAALAEYLDNPDAGRVERTKYRDKAAAAVPRH